MLFFYSAPFQILIFLVTFFLNVQSNTTTITIINYNLSNHEKNLLLSSLNSNNSSLFSKPTIFTLLNLLNQVMLVNRFKQQVTFQPSMIFLRAIICRFSLVVTRKETTTLSNTFSFMIPIHLTRQKTFDSDNKISNYIW